LLEVAVFDLLHEGAALEEVALEVGGELAGHDEKLVVGDFGKGDGAARGNEMRAPLEHEASVPESSDGEKGDCGSESGALGAEESRGAVEKNGEAENEKRRERNEKAVAVRRDAGPVRVTGNEKIKSEKAARKGVPARRCHRQKIKRPAMEKRRMGVQESRPWLEEKSTSRKAGENQSQWLSGM